MDAEGNVCARQARTALVLSQLLALRGAGMPPVTWHVDSYSPDELEGQLGAGSFEPDRDGRARAGMQAWADVLGAPVAARPVARPDGGGYTHLSVSAEWMTVPVTVWAHVELHAPARAANAGGGS